MELCACDLWKIIYVCITSVHLSVWIFLLISCFYHLEVILLCFCLFVCFAPKEASKWVKTSYCLDSGAKTAHIPQLTARSLPSLLCRVLLALPTAFCPGNCHYWGWDKGHLAMLRFLFLLIGLIGLQTDSSSKYTIPWARPSDLSGRSAFLWVSSERLAISLAKCFVVGAPTLWAPVHSHIATFSRQHPHCSPGGFPTLLGTIGGRGGGGRRGRGGGGEMPCKAWVNASGLVYYKLLCVFYPWTLSLEGQKDPSLYVLRMLAPIAPELPWTAHRSVFLSQ